MTTPPCKREESSIAYVDDKMNADAPGDAKILSHLHAVQYEDETLQALALSVMPDRVLELAQPSPEQEDELATRLLAWFKTDFFAWVCQQPLERNILLPLPHILLKTHTAT